MKKIMFLLGAFALVGMTASLQATTVDFASLIGQTVQLTVQPYTTGETNGAYSVGLTEGYINGDPTQSFWMYCVDFSHTISVPATYTVTVRGLTPATFTPDNLGLSLDALQQINTLGLNFGTSPTGNLSVDQAAQQLIWNYSGGTYPADTTSASLNNAMLGSYLTRNYSHSFLLDTNGDGQAFMPPDSPVPEPATLSLFGMGLLGLGAAGRRYLG